MTRSNNKRCSFLQSVVLQVIAAGDESWGMGGGLAIAASNAIIQSSTLSNGSAIHGSGLAVLQSNVTVLDSQITDNVEVQGNVSAVSSSSYTLSSASSDITVMC
jgi:hypothetical protein